MDQCLEVAMMFTLPTTQMLEHAASYTNFGYTYKLPNGCTYNTPETNAVLAGIYNYAPTGVEVYIFVNSE